MSNPTFFSVLLIDSHNNSHNYHSHHTHNNSHDNSHNNSQSSGTALSRLCHDKGCSTTSLMSARDGFEVLENLVPGLLLIVLGDNIAVEFELIRAAAEKGSDVLVVGPSDGNFEKKALSLGAREYFSQPVSLEQLGAVLEAGPSKESGATNGLAVQEQISDLLLGGCGPMQNVFKQIARVAPTSAPVLITGESGTGKEKAAEAIHRLSRRRDRPFLPANCGAISPQLIQSELFGHEKGSFTGAVREHAGYFERADGGTLFLDEITEMPVELQVNLLRVLETGTFARVGSSRQQKSNVRIVAATNRDPYRAVDEGHLREDLLYRIQVFPLDMPPLRERNDDVELLARHFLKEHNRQENRSRRFSAKALEALRQYSWPGNLRELKNVVYRAFIMADDVIDVSDLPSEIRTPRSLTSGPNGFVQVGATLAEMEEKLIISTLIQCEGRRERAARMLGISTKTLYNRLREYRGREDCQVVSDAR